MKFIELTYHVDGRNIIFPIGQVIAIDQEYLYCEVFLKNGARFKVKEALSEIERKICWVAEVSADKYKLIGRKK